MIGRAARVPLACALIAVLACGTAVAATISVEGRDVSVLVRMAENEPLAEVARATDPGFEFVPKESHYDGVYYYAIARDPLATGEEHLKIDLAAYRYEHAGYGLLAAVLSLGIDGLVPAVLLALNLAAAAVGAWIASVLSRRLGLTPWGGLVVALNPGIIYAATSDTSEPVGVAILGLFLLAWFAQRWGWVVPLGALLCLTKETFVLVPIALGLWELIRYLRGERGRRLLFRWIVLATGPLALIAWVLYLQSRFDVWPFSQSPDILRIPLAGWIETLGQAAAMGMSPTISQQIGQTTVALLVASGGILLIGCLVAIRFRTLIDVLFVASTLAVFCLGPLGLAFPKDFFRLSSVPFILLGAVLARPREDIDGDAASPRIEPGDASATIVR